MRKIIIAAVAAWSAGIAVVSGAAAAPNPSGTGQPNASCEDPGAVAPHGFGTDRFANGESHYAGSDGTPSQRNAHSEHAVSQYGIACYQLGST